MRRREVFRLLCAVLGVGLLPVRLRARGRDCTIREVDGWILRGDDS